MMPMHERYVMGTPMIDTSFTFPDDGPTVHRIGYGTMQLTAHHASGPPRDREEAVAVLRAAIAAGVDHIDTAETYGPHTVNQLIRSALSPYPAGLTIVSKVGWERDSSGGWYCSLEADALRRQVEDNLRNLGLDRLSIVNLRLGGPVAPEEGPAATFVERIVRLKEEGLIDAIGLSNVTPGQVREARQVTSIACVQNQYNLANRGDDELIDELEALGIAYVPFFPLGGFSPVQSVHLSEVANAVNATPMQVALAWLLRRARNVLLIPGTSSAAHLRENLAALALDLDESQLNALDAISAV